MDYFFNHETKLLINDHIYHILLRSKAFEINWCIIQGEMSILFYTEARQWRDKSRVIMKLFCHSLSIHVLLPQMLQDSMYFLFFDIKYSVSYFSLRIILKHKLFVAHRLSFPPLLVIKSASNRTISCTYNLSFN